MALNYENLLTQMLGIGKDLLDHQRIISFSEFSDKVEALTEEEIIRSAQVAWSGAPLTQITYKKAV